MFSTSFHTSSQAHVYTRILMTSAHLNLYIDFLPMKHLRKKGGTAMSYMMPVSTSRCDFKKITHKETCFQVSGPSPGKHIFVRVKTRYFVPVNRACFTHVLPFTPRPNRSEPPKSQNCPGKDNRCNTCFLNAPIRKTLED